MFIEVKRILCFFVFLNIEIFMFFRIIEINYLNNEIVYNYVLRGKRIYLDLLNTLVKIFIVGNKKCY